MKKEKTNLCLRCSCKIPSGLRYCESCQGFVNDTVELGQGALKLRVHQPSEYENSFGHIAAIAGILLCLILSGCTVVSANRVFPKLTWYWNKDAQEQRREEQLHKRLHPMPQISREGTK